MDRSSLLPIDRSISSLNNPDNYGQVESLDNLDNRGKWTSGVVRQYAIAVNYVLFVVVRSRAVPESYCSVYYGTLCL